jgi:hypothetical protein
MTGTPVRRASDEAAFSTRLERGRTWLGVLLPVLLIAGLVLARSAGVTAIRPAFAAAATSTDPAALLASAADQLEAATAKGGPGYTFEVVARSVLYARPDGPKIEVPDPLDPTKTLGLADEYDVGGSIASGFVTPDGYVLQMRRGPATRQDAPDFEKAETTLAALVRDGKDYRNDGDGWYETDLLPGIGLDPRTIAGLPALLRHGTEAKAEDAVTVAGTSLAAVSATGTVADAPGLMAIDAAPFTEFTGPLTYAVDDQGRLAQLTVRMRDTNSKVFELIVETTITFGYDGVPSELPKPEPPAPPPSADPKG